MKIATIAAMLCMSSAVFAADPPALGKVYDSAVGSVEKEVVSLVEAMPADTLKFRPSGAKFEDVRTFAQQAKHIAAVNYMLAAAMLKEKAPIDLGKGENGPDSVVSKEQVVKFLKDSFAYAHKAALAMTPANQLEMLPSPFGQGQMSRTGAALILTSHPFDHYGQMVVSARLNGIVPPASR